MKKKILFALGGFIVLILGAAAALPLLFDANSFRPQIQSALESSLKRKIDLGTLSLKFYPLSVKVNDVKVAEDDKYSSTIPFLTASEILVNLDLRSLLNKQVKVDALTIIRPTVNLIRNAEGKWNYESVGQQKESGGDSKLSFTELTVQDGTVTINRATAPSQTLTGVNVALHDFVPGKPTKVEASARLPGEGKQLVEIAGIVDKGFDGKFTLTDVSQAGLKGIAATGTVRATTATAPIQFSTNLTMVEPAFSGMIDGTVTPGDQIKASINAKNLQVNRKEWKHPVHIAVLQMTLSDDVATFQPFVVESGEFRANANLKVNDVSKSPMIEARIESAGTIAEMLATASAFGASVKDVNASGKIALQATLNGPANRPEAINYRASGTLDGATITVAGLAKPVQLRHASFHATPDLVQFEVETPELSLVPAASSGGQAGKTSTAFRQSLRGSAKIGKLVTSELTFDNVQTQFSLHQGNLKMDPLEGTLYGGKIGAAIESDLRQDPIQVQVTTKVNGIDALQLLSSTTGLKQLLSGRLTADGGLRFHLRPNEPLAKSLNGTVKFELTDGRLNGLNLVNEFARIGQFLGFSAKATSFTDFVKLAGAIKIENGVAQSDNIRLEFGGGSLGAAGTLNLLDESMNMKLMTTLDKDFSRSAGGTQIGGFLSTVLANEKGELILPILATGLLSKPKLVPDAGQIAKMKLQSGAGIVKSVKDIQNAAEGVKDFFDQFRKK